MNEEEAAAFLFSIAKEIKRSFESPVILVNKKDYAANIHKLLREMRQSLIVGTSPESIVDTVVGFHLEWLQAVRDLRGLKSNVKDTPREVFWEAIDYSIECVKSRYSSFKQYIEHLQKSLTQKDVNLMQAEIELIEDMQKSVIVVLEEKRRFLQYQSDLTEFIVKVEFEIEELMNWLDRLNDNLVVQLCKVVGNEDPGLLAELSNTLKRIIEEVTIVTETDSLTSVFKKDPLSRPYMVRISASHDLEIKKVRDKIKLLEERIERLKGESSAATMALQHKKMYLENRLCSLENLKESLEKIKDDNESISDLDFFDGGKEVHIFNHWLPISGRYRLVEELITLWKAAIQGTTPRKSVISILSVADFKEIYEDSLGNFFIDKYGRKLYEKDNDVKLYQMNEHNELVPVTDDDQHVYFYDNCGRYYLSASDHRVYKAHDSASEYIMHPLGYMVKHKEVIDGKDYWFDKLGRYYLDENSHRIYHSEGDSEEYIHDGFGNLIPLDSAEKAYCTKEVPTTPMVMKESHYLKRNVGEALKHCIMDVVMHQPADPIGYLANALEMYWRQGQANEQQRQEECELRAERTRIATEEAEAKAAAEAAAMLLTEREMSGEASERHSVDSNLLHYQTQQQN